MAPGAMIMGDPYLDALARKARAFGELLQLSRGQDEVLGRDDPEALLALLARKKALIQGIEGIDREMAALPGGRPGGPLAETLVAEIRGVLQEIVACEEETKRRVEAMKRETLEEISRIRNGRRAAELYRRNRPSGGTVDREE